MAHENKYKVKAANTTMTKAIDKLICQTCKDWLHIPGVIDISSSITNGNDCILVFVNHKTTEVENLFPCKLNGFPVIIIETTDFYIG